MEESSADEQPRFPRQTPGLPRDASSWEAAGHRGHSTREKVHRYQKAKKELCLSISHAISEQNGDDDQVPPKGGGNGKGKRKTKVTANGAANATGAVDHA